MFQDKHRVQKFGTEYVDIIKLMVLYGANIHDRFRCSIIPGETYSPVEVILKTVLKDRMDRFAEFKALMADREPEETARVTECLLWRVSELGTFVSPSAMKGS